MIVEGHMQWLFDETGRRYLDLFAGIVTVSCGHCHPKVTAAIKTQVDTLQHATTIYLHPELAVLAKKLASKMPDGLDVTYFVNSGSEANDLAILMARIYTGNQRRDRGAQFLSRRVSGDQQPDFPQHLEVSGQRGKRRPPHRLSRSIPQPVHRHAGGDRRRRAWRTSRT